MNRNEFNRLFSPFSPLKSPTVVAGERCWTWVRGIHTAGETQEAAVSIRRSGGRRKTGCLKEVTPHILGCVHSPPTAWWPSLQISGKRETLPPSVSESNTTDSFSLVPADVRGLPRNRGRDATVSAAAGLHAFWAALLLLTPVLPRHMQAMWQ